MMLKGVSFNDDCWERLSESRAKIRKFFVISDPKLIDGQWYCGETLDKETFLSMIYNEYTDWSNVVIRLDNNGPSDTSVCCTLYSAFFHHDINLQVLKLMERNRHFLKQLNMKFTLKDLCQEAFKPSRVMYQLSLDPDYYY